MNQMPDQPPRVVRPWAMEGPSIQIDPLFPYYVGRSRESIAEEIELAGYRTVHYFVVRENQVDAGLVDAFQRRGIAVWAMVLGNGAFGSSHLPPEWNEWRMELLKEPKDGFQRLSHFSSEYVDWKKRAVAQMVTNIPFDGFEVAEPYFPEWNGLRTGTYGDVGPHARQAFRERCGEEIPEFIDKRASNFYKKVPDLYAQWVDMRVDGVNSLIDELVNGAEGVREKRPDIWIATWSLALCGGRRTTARLREWQGLDAVSMISRVSPDMHVLQTHWPDWMRRHLPPDYITHYEGIAASVRSMFPGLPIGVQADIGSLARMVRTRRWINEFEIAAFDGGYDTWTAYEYHLGGYMYDEPPIPLKAVQSATAELTISFSKRIAPASVQSVEAHVRNHSGAWRRLVVLDTETDGNRLWLSVNQLSCHDCDLKLAGVQDTPDLWHVKGRRANVVKGEYIVQIEHPLQDGNLGNKE